MFNQKKTGTHVLSCVAFFTVFILDQWLSFEVTDAGIITHAFILAVSFFLLALFVPYPFSLSGLVFVPVIFSALLLFDNAFYVDHLIIVLVLLFGGTSGIFARKKKTAMSILVAGLSSSMIYYSYWRATLINVKDCQQVDTVLVNQTAEKALNGAGRSLEFHEDTIYLLNFTGHYCLPCQQKKPATDSIKKLFRNKPFRLITVHCFEPYEVFRQRYANDLDAYHDEEDKLSHLFKVTGLPTEIIIGSFGGECCRVEGYNSEQYDNYLGNRSAVIRKQLQLIRKK